MDLVHLILSLAVVGLIWYLLTTYVPMPAPIKTVITAIAVIILCLFLLQLGGFTQIKIGG